MKPMIRRLVVSNYRSLGEQVVLDCDDLTVLIGPNGSGKSNIADVIRFVAECARDGLSTALARRQGIGAVRRWGTDEIAIRIELEHKSARGSWEFALIEQEGRALVHREAACWQLKKKPSPAQVKRETDVAEAIWKAYPPRRASSRLDKVKKSVLRALQEGVFQFELSRGKLTEGSQPIAVHGQQEELVLPFLAHTASAELFRPLHRMLMFNTVYSIFPNVLRQPQPPDPYWPMREHGQNWATALMRLQETSARGELLAALGRITDDIDDYRVTQTGGFVIPEFRHGVDPAGSERWLGAVQESDGTLRLAGLLTALLQEPSPRFIGLEEPELSLHPGAIPVLMDFIKEASECRSQVLLTTQSPELLDLVDIEAVRMVERREGVTTVTRVHPFQRQAIRDHLTTSGVMWRAGGLQGASAVDDLERHG